MDTYLTNVVYPRFVDFVNDIIKLLRSVAQMKRKHGLMQSTEQYWTTLTEKLPL